MSNEKDNVIRLVEGEELAFVIKTLASTGSITITRKRFEVKYGRKVTAEHIQRVQSKYQDKISAKSVEYNTKGGLDRWGGLSKRARIEILLEVIDLGLQESVVGVYSQADPVTGEKQTLPIIKRELNAVLVALKALRDEDFGGQELEIKKRKGDPDSGGEWEGELEVTTGVS